MMRDGDGTKGALILKGAISYRAFNSGGPGGQHSNRTLNAIEAKLNPEVAVKLGIPAVSAVGTLKSQVRSKALARRRLIERIRVEMRLKLARGRFTAGHHRVRTYHEPDDRVQDAGGSYSYRITVGKGDLSAPIDGLRGKGLAK